MTRLNQIIAIESGVKNTAKSEIDRLYHAVQRTQKDGPFHGISRHTPNDTGPGNHTGP